MLEVFFGNDTIKVRRKALERVDSLREQGAAVEFFDESGYQPGRLSDAAASVSLFGDARAYAVDTPSSRKEMYEETTGALPAMRDSAHTFVVIEAGLLAAEKKRFEKHASRIEEYKAPAKERFNSFALADALSKKDKRSLWVLFNQARLQNIALEELVGVLWWQLKTLRLAEAGKSAAETGLKDFAWSKAKRALPNFKAGELASLSRSLLSLSHDSRLGLHDLDHALERWILKL